MLSTRAAAGLFIAVSVVWGSTWIANDMLAQTESPLHILVLRYCLGGLVAGMAFACQALRNRFRAKAGRKSDPSPTTLVEACERASASDFSPRFAILSALDGPDPGGAEVMRVSAVLGCTMFALPNLLLVLAAHHGAAAWTPLLYAALPLGLLLTSGKLSSTAILAVGAMLIVLNGTLPLSPEKLAWAALIALAVGLQGWSLVYAHEHLAAASSLRGIMTQLLVATELLVVTLQFWQEPSGHLPIRSWPISSLGALCFLGIVGTAIAYPLYYRLLSSFEPATVAASAWLQTLVAIGESAVLLRQRPGLAMIGATIVLITCTGVLLRQQDGAQTRQLEL